jgi:hypothetical protein
MKQVIVLIAFFATASYLMMNSDRTTLGNKITANIENLRSTDAYASMVVGTESYIKIDNRKNLLADIDDIKALYHTQQKQNNTNRRMSEGNIKVFNFIIKELTNVIDECPRSVNLLQGDLPINDMDEIDIDDIQAMLITSYPACS